MPLYLREPCMARSKLFCRPCLGFIMLPCPVLLQVRSRLGGRVLRGVRAYAGVSPRDVPPALAVHLSHRVGWQVL